MDTKYYNTSGVFDEESVADDSLDRRFDRPQFGDPENRPMIPPTPPSQPKPQGGGAVLETTTPSLTDEQIDLHFYANMTPQQIVDKANELGVVLSESDINKIEALTKNKYGLTQEQMLLIGGGLIGLIILIVALRK